MSARARIDDLVVGRAREFVEPVEILVAREVGEVRAVLDAAEARAAAGAYVVGFVSYEAAPAFDPALVVRSGGTASPLPLAWFGAFAVAKAVEPVGAPERPVRARWRSEWSEAEHRRAVGLVKESLSAGWTYQVNLTTRQHSDSVDDAFALYRQLASAQASPFNCFLATEEWAIASASPELFFERRDGAVTSRPMKGTVARGATPREDAARAEALRASAKERAENVMIVDLIRNDLGRIAAFGTVEVPELFALEAYPTVWQMTSTVRARPATARLSELFGALFPCGSVTGAPKPATMRLITELEDSPRGLYCGAIGVIEPGGVEPDARFAVAIRTATVERTSGHATYGVGGGVVWDSDPAAEWAEIEAKSSVLTYRRAPFGLIETFRFESGRGFVNLDAHLARLAASARWCGIEFSDVRARERLEGLRGELASTARVRLVLRPDGELESGAGPLEPDAVEPLVLAIDDVDQDERDELLAHKVTDRRRYEEAIRRHPDADDVVLRNRLGEVTETTRANLAVRLEGRWWTPPLRSGLLPGIERARLLDAGVLAERAIRVEELEHAEAVATLSSLRGWRRAVLVAGAGAQPVVSLRSGEA